MRRIKPLLTVLFFLPLLLCGGEYFQDIRSRAALCKLYSQEDFSLGRELIAEMKKMGQNRTPVFKTPRFIMEAVSYRLGRLYETSNSWYDRQLFVDRRLWKGGASPFQVPSIARSFNIMRSYGAGCSFFAGSSYVRNAEPFYRAAEKFPGFTVVPTLHVAPQRIPDVKLFREVADNPHSLKIGGKGVILTYDCDKLSPQQFKNYLEKLKKRAGDKDFTVIPEMSGHYMKFGWNRKKYGKFEWPRTIFMQRKQVSAIQLLHCFDLLTRYLRLSGGLDLPTYSGKRDQTLNSELYEELLLPLFSAVCAQKEFNGKKVLLFQVMHCYTSYHGSQTIQADGTETLRRYLELCEKYKVDIPLGFEWDELNEGTNLEPTVARPMALQKIIRYWMDKNSGALLKKPTAAASELPDLIISQRRQLNLGTELKIELLNVPDSSLKETFQVVLTLLDHQGKKVYTSEKMAFDRSRMMAKSVVLKSEKFASARLLRPHLQILRGGKRYDVSAGLPYTVIRPTVCNDQTWFNTPLRNVLSPVAGEVKFSEPAAIAPGVVRFIADVDLTLPENIMSAEIVQNSNSVFAWDPKNEYHQHSADRALYRINYRYFNNPCFLPVQLGIKSNVASLLSYTDGENSAKTAKIISGFPAQMKINADVWVNGKSFSIAAKDIPQAKITISGTRLGGAFKGRTFSETFVLKDLGEYGIKSKVFEDGLVISVERLYRPTRLPLPINSRRVKFQLPVVCDNPDSAAALRLVSENGKVWWSKAFVPGTGKKSPASVTVNAWCDRRGALSFPVPAERVFEINYNFTPLYGNILTTAAGRDFYAHCGSFLSLSTGFEGTLGSRYTIPGCHNHRKVNQLNTPAPGWVKLPDNRYALYFDGKNGNFVNFSNSVLSQRCGFTVEFEIKPEKLSGKRMLFCQFGPMYQTGFALAANNGRLQASFRRRTRSFKEPGTLNFNSGIVLKEKVWQKVRLSYDGSTLEISSGKQKKSFRCSGIPIWLSISTFGGDARQGMFCGYLRSMKITHYKGGKGI